MNGMDRQDAWADHLDLATPHPDLATPHPDPATPQLDPATRQSLDRLRARLADESAWGEPPAGLRSALLERAAAESAALQALGPRTGTRQAGSVRARNSGSARNSASARRRQAWWLT